MSFNGWTNYETWNVALWMDNDEPTYHIARTSKDFNNFRDELKFLTGVVKSGDGVNHRDSKLNIEELNEKIREYHEG